MAWEELAAQKEGNVRRNWGTGKKEGGMCGKSKWGWESSDLTKASGAAIVTGVFASKKKKGV